MSAPRSGLVPVAEAVTAGLAVAAVVGFGRLFEGGGWLWPCLAAAVGSSGTAAFLRRRGWGVGPAGAVSAVAGLAVLSWLLYGETTAYGVPTGATLSAMRADLAGAWRLFQEVAAPTAAAPGFVLAAAAAVWGAAFLADWAAFRLWTPIEALVPSATLFIFTALLGTDDHRTFATAAWLGTAIAFVLVHRVARQDRGTSWLASDPRAGARSLLRVGGVLGAGALAAALVLGPAVPGAARPGLVDWKSGGGGGARVTVSPLVDIRSRLVAREDTVVFTVRTTARSYWRLTALDRFDGRIWSSEREYDRVGGDLPGATPEREAEPVRQEFSVTGLDSIWAPAAYQPVRLEDASADLRYDAESATLIVDTDQESSDGITYAVDSTLPVHDEDELAAASGRAPQDILERYTQLPDDFSALARTEAARAVNRVNFSPTPYQLAMQLQSYFRSGAFTYDLSVRAGHDESAIDQFLTTRRGYCEQFAGAYAAMARSLGLPARVAVGFTPGEQEEPGVYTVRGLNAHAWPEVYFVGIGWVPFEPTPGRGAPGAEAWTGIPEQQADPADPESATTTTDSTTPGGPTSTVNRNLLPDEAFPTGASTNEPLGEDEPSLWSRVWGWLRAALVAAVAVALVWAAGVPLARVVRARARRQAATTPSERVLAAWREADDRLTMLGVRSRPAETHREFAGRAGRELGTAGAGHLRSLASLATAADYAPGGATDGQAEEADRLVGELAGVVTGRATRDQRLRWWLDPRPLLPRRGARVRVADTTVHTSAA